MGLARALSLEPEIILYDEPNAGLEPWVDVATAPASGWIASIAPRHARLPTRLRRAWKKRKRGRNEGLLAWASK